MKSVNKTARRDFEIVSTIEVGVVLTGSEVKSAKKEGIQLKDSYVKIVSGVPMLIHSHIPHYKQASYDKQHDPDRTRNLLMHKKEILKLQTKLKEKQNLTIIPLSCYVKSGMIKCEIALAKRRKNWQVKKVEQNRTETRRIEKDIRERLKKG